MRKKAYQNSKLKHQLFEKQRRGVKEVIWTLKPEQKEFIEERLKFTTEEYLYQVKTKSFLNIKGLKYNILKTIHLYNKKGKRTVVLKLDNKEKKILDEYGVSYWPYKYKIKLCS